MALLVWFACELRLNKLAYSTQAIENRIYDKTLKFTNSVPKTMGTYSDIHKVHFTRIAICQGRKKYLLQLKKILGLERTAGRNSSVKYSSVGCEG